MARWWTSGSSQVSGISGKPLFSQPRPPSSEGPRPEPRPGVQQCNPFPSRLPQIWRVPGPLLTDTRAGPGACMGQGNKASRGVHWEARAAEGSERPGALAERGSSGLREEDCHGNVSLGYPIRMETAPSPQASPTELGHRGDCLGVSMETA